MAPDFYQSHLQRVSRSFSFCIAQLEGDFRDWVSLSYLLCRLLDTVEDAEWVNAAAQADAYQRFQGFLASMPSETEVAAWVAAFAPTISEGERLLLEEARGCFQRFHAAPKMVRTVMSSAICNMYRGMRFFSAERKRGREFRLRSLTDVNQYCFFVAGVVGDLLTNLLAGASGRAVKEEQLVDGHHFGLFLQKVNILKDQRDDERQGRHLVTPSREVLLASMEENAEGAIRYILELPVAERGYRTFCAWSLFIGLSSLRWMERTKLFGYPLLNKPPRVATKKVLREVAERIDSNEALLELFRKKRPRFPKFIAQAQNADTSVLQAYEGPLKSHQLKVLGLI